MADNPIYGIGLCAGALGLELGLETAIPGYRTVCMVEREIAVCGRVAARVAEGSIPPLACWDDVTTFDGRPWRGIVSILSAGFPCQPFSVAGKRKGTDDARWIWPDIARIIGEVEPELVFLENVPGLLLDPAGDIDRWEMEEQPDDALGGMGTVLRDLAQLRFSAEWLCLRASDVGASHGRKRVFILAYRERARRDGGTWAGILSDGPGDGADSDVAHTTQDGKLGLGGEAGRIGRRGICETGERVEDTEHPRPSPAGAEIGSLQPADLPLRSDGQLEHATPTKGTRLTEQREYVPRPANQELDGISIFTPGPSDPIWQDVLLRRPWLRPSWAQAEVESHFRDLVDGLAPLLVTERTTALRALGNGVVPLQAAAAFTILARRVAGEHGADTGAHRTR